MLTEQMEQHYEAVLHDLQRRRAHCQEELAELDQAIAAMRKALPVQPPPSLGIAPPAQVLGRPGEYAGMSMRWAILNFLAEDAQGPIGTGGIAQALQKGGLVSNGKSFTSNVSAVLSVMANTRNEVEQADGGYRITEHGREVWTGIKRTEQYQNRGSSNGQQRPV